MTNRREATRKKLLKLLTRNQLERMSFRERPWMADRSTLEGDVLAHWNANADELRDILTRCIEGVFE